MSLISQEDINKVIEANDLVDIAGDAIPDLKLRGGKYIACCPFHKEKTPSFTIDQNLQLWHCFGCGEGGNLITFIEKYYDYNFVEAIEMLAKRANIEIKRTQKSNQYSRSKKGKLLLACKKAAQYYHNQLMKVRGHQNDLARAYLGKRGLGTKVSKKWMLGYAPGNNKLTNYMLSLNFTIDELLESNLCVNGKDGKIHDRFFNRIIFPIQDIHDNVIGFGGRIITQGQPKYLNTNENILFHKSKVLYGINKAKYNMATTGTAVVVEGYTDVIALHEAGINYAVATLGTALTKMHIRTLNQHAKNNIIYLFDGDAAGQKAAQRALQFIDQMDLPENYQHKANLKASCLPENLDPAEFIEKYGSEKLLELIENAEMLIDFGIKKVLEKYDLNMPDQRANAAISALNILAPIKDSVNAASYIREISSKTGINEDILLFNLSKLKKKTEYSKKQDEKLIPNHDNFYKLEIELLSLLAKSPNVYIENEKLISQIKWKNEITESVYNAITKFIKQNPSIKHQELLLKIHNIAPKSANMLTRLSKMYDFKNSPERHVLYLVYSILKKQCKDEKFKTMQQLNQTNENSLYKKIAHLNTKINKYNALINEVI